MACNENFRTDLVVRCHRCGCEELLVELGSQSFDVAIICPRCSAIADSPVVIEHMKLSQAPCNLNLEHVQTGKPTTH